METRRDWFAPGDGSRLPHTAAMGLIGAGPVVLLGEQHDKSFDHRWQLAVLAGLAAMKPGLAVGLEMFPRHAQPILDAWVKGVLTEAAFLEAVRWSEVWGFDAGLYMPILHLCRDIGVPMIGLNVDRPIVSLVGRDGWDALPAAERTWMTPARAASLDYRAYLYTITGGARPGRSATGPEDPAFDRFVRAQQVWDRAFACSIARYLAERPDRSVAALIGRGHMEYGYGTPDQLADLGLGRVVVALPGLSALEGVGSVADLVFMPGAVA